MTFDEAIAAAIAAAEAGKTRPDDQAGTRPRWPISVQNRLQDEVLPALIQASQVK